MPRVRRKLCPICGEPMREYTRAASWERIEDEDNPGGDWVATPGTRAVASCKACGVTIEVVKRHRDERVAKARALDGLDKVWESNLYEE